MKTILIYGDSITWGCIPNGVDLKTMIFQRYKQTERWSGQLQTLLGDNVRVIEEGLNGRTTVFDDPLLPDRNGFKYLSPCLLSHQPIDLVIMMLGSNDLKGHLGLQATDVAKGMRNLVKLVKLSNVGPKGGVPQILVISPPSIRDGIGLFSSSFLGAETKSQALAENYGWVCEFEECHFFDSNQVIHSSQVDGVHLDKVQNTVLAKALLPEIKKLIKLD
ncbi:SGNH/GDSL hydrolase family protein [Shewanella surugensis]|uniref:SGNH/GDSL hydrolase family protein n=1 Tax=Shewanella surugensis TaxID=212020 RepID=A0ABT0LEA9_9GAMM|nr:SGNH/GDSL hydrolase family protein [Shewanella surugensis]MCL1125665.1 SGNH/GDSL hydrolase family protein [Shewanella surugensis]